MPSLTDQIAELASVVREQMAEIERLRAENAHQCAVIDRQRAEVSNLVAWANGDVDALSCLQKVYSDPRVTEASRIKAAAAALPFERAKPASQSVVGVVDFREYVRTIRLRSLEKDRAKWALEDAEAKALEGSGTLLGGPGEDPAA